MTAMFTSFNTRVRPVPGLQPRQRTSATPSRPLYHPSRWNQYPSPKQPTAPIHHNGGCRLSNLPLTPERPSQLLSNDSPPPLSRGNNNSQPPSPPASLCVRQMSFADSVGPSGCPSAVETPAKGSMESSPLQTDVMPLPSPCGRSQGSIFRFNPYTSVLSVCDVGHYDPLPCSLLPARIEVTPPPPPYSEVGDSHLNLPTLPPPPPFPEHLEDQDSSLGSSQLSAVSVVENDEDESPPVPSPQAEAVSAEVRDRSEIQLPRPRSQCPIPTTTIKGYHTYIRATTREIFQAHKEHLEKRTVATCSPMASSHRKGHRLILLQPDATGVEAFGAYFDPSVFQGGSPHAMPVEEEKVVVPMLPHITPGAWLRLPAVDCSLTIATVKEVLDPVCGCDSYELDLLPRILRHPSPEDTSAREEAKEAEDILMGPFMGLAPERVRQGSPVSEILKAIKPVACEVTMDFNKVSIHYKEVDRLAASRRRETKNNWILSARWAKIPRDTPSTALSGEPDPRCFNLTRFDRHSSVSCLDLERLKGVVICAWYGRRKDEAFFRFVQVSSDDEEEEAM